MKLLNQQEAINLDQELFNDCGYSVYQLMELAGLSVAQIIAKCYPITDGSDHYKKPIVCCGPGNNGGDGLVAARHLKLFGYSPIVIYPKEPKQELYKQLLKQCRSFDIEIINMIPEESLDKLGNLIVDCIFGFSFKPPNRNADFARLLNKIDECCHRTDATDAISGEDTNSVSLAKIPLISVDIPSGWDVEKGPQNIESSQADLDQSMRIPILKPDCLISLTAPKLCSTSFDGQYHYLGGRFCPQKLLTKYNLTLPDYSDSEGILLLSQKPSPINNGSISSINIVTKVLSRLRSIKI